MSTVRGADSLRQLALDLRWSWNHSADDLWAQLDPDLWALTHNPWVVLQTVSPTRLQQTLESSKYRARLDRLIDLKERYATRRAWFQERHSGSPLTGVAYFSMEFGLSEALPIYSGGLGNVAGDHLKAGSDLGIPLVGVGLLYQQGYFRQVINAEGCQEALYPYNDPGQLPITPVRNASGEWLRLEFPLLGRNVWIRVWQVQVGRVTLYLLDSNDPANPPAVRGVTSELYGGGPELRLRQEMVLGMGGWQLLRALGVEPEVCHLNEGHAAFAVLARAHSFMDDSGQPFEVALAVTRAGNVFTTHTPVAAGFDRFAPALVAQYMRHYAEETLRIGLNELLALGREHADDPGEAFNMAYLALRGSGAVNGVSRLHGSVSRRIFQHLFPRWAETEVPVGYVTNGVHTPSWDSPDADALWTDACGPERWRGSLTNVARDLRRVSDTELWAMRTRCRRALLDYLRPRMARQLESIGTSAEEAASMGERFDPEALTMAFARRFATYKRPNLLLHDPARLLRILTDEKRPVQLVVAGKAHPADEKGRAMVREWVEFSRRPEARGRVIFVPDYDMLLAERLVQGADVWINTPRRPWEASGTSGMKVLVNGGLNVSELDGWWAEAYAPEVGWALGDGQEHGDDPAWDAAEAEALYALLEYEVVPAFYDRDARGIPCTWTGKMRESMARLTPWFSASRSVWEYTERYYLPAAAAYGRRSIAEGKLGGEIVGWKQHLARHLYGAHFGPFSFETRGDEHHIAVEVQLGELHPDAVCVELCAVTLDGTGRTCRVMARGEALPGPGNGAMYRAVVPSSQPASDYTPRLVPYHPEAAVPLEAPGILWQR